MKNNDNIKTDKVVDAFYTGVASQLVEEMIAENDALDMPEHDFSSMDDWFASFNEKNERKEQLKTIKKHSKKFLKVAVIALIMIGASFSGLMIGVEAFRVSVFNIFVSEEVTHTLFEQVEDDILEQLLIPYPRIMPKGFKLYSYEELDEIKVIEFQNNVEDYITYTISKEGVSAQLNTENADVENIIFNDKELTLVSSENKRQIFWNNDDYSFNIVSNLDFEKIKKIINSIK